MTFDELILYLEGHAEFPSDISERDLHLFESEITQSQILNYYVIVNRLSSDQKGVVLKRWLPKPKKLFHASSGGQLEVLSPSQSPRDPDEPDAVFAAVKLAIAAMFLIKSAKMKCGSYDGGQTWTVVVADVDDFRRQDNGGYIYTLPPETFGVNPDLGLGLFEWTSHESVKPEFVEFYPSAIQLMLESSVKIFTVGVETFEKFNEPGQDQITLLKNFLPLETI